MKKEDKDQKKKEDQIIEGYNPGVYRSLSILFIVLTILNLAAIIFAFAVTGYGLWHAEDALSCIAKVDSSFGDINQNILKMQLYPDDQSVVVGGIDNIRYYQQEIEETAVKFRGINLKNVDKTLPGKFESVMAQIDQYNNRISGSLDDIRSGKVSADLLHNTELEQLREEAKSDLDRLFDEQDDATYVFFCRVAQRFLFVILFLLLTMTAGLVAISKSKKRDLAYALEIQESKKKTANIRQKAVEIAYTNVVTGLKNRYALIEELDTRMKTEDLTLCLFNFNNFKRINEKYGRDYADEFVAYMSKKLTKAFGDQVEIFSTEIDEFCMLFNKDMPKSRTEGIAQKALSMLSQPMQVQEAQIQLTVAGCLCNCAVNAYHSASKLFIALDYNIQQAKQECAKKNTSVIMHLQ